MVSRIFLDANILLDFILKREGYPAAKRIIEKIIEGQISAFISPSIVHIVGYWLTKSFGASKTRELILALLAHIRVIEIDHEITIHALHSKINDVEDALQYYTAIHHKLDAFITEDKQLRKAATGFCQSLLPNSSWKRWSNCCRRSTSVLPFSKVRPLAFTFDLLYLRRTLTLHP